MEVPSFEDEIERKAADTLATVISSYEQQRISTEVAAAAIRTLYLTVSGLVSTELMSLIVAADTELRGRLTKEGVVVDKNAFHG